MSAWWRAYCINIKVQLFHWPSLVSIIEYCSFLNTLPESVKYSIPILLNYIFQYFLAVKNSGSLALNLFRCVSWSVLKVLCHLIYEIKSLFIFLCAVSRILSVHFVWVYFSKWQCIKKIYCYSLDHTYNMVNNSRNCCRYFDFGMSSIFPAGNWFCSNLLPLKRLDYSKRITLGDSEGQGSLACSSPWGHKELDMI